MIMSVESKEGVSDFVDGFWINSDYEFTRGSDALYWIPPCRLLHVEKWTPHLL